MKRISSTFALLVLSTQIAWADRPVTAEEHARINSVIAAFGCFATDIEFDDDDNRYEIDDADCGGRERYDMELNTSFEIVDGERPVTPLERQLIDAALEKLGCSGGTAEFEFDDKYFEIEDVRCDGGRYEVKLTQDFDFIQKSPD
ncbi:hypothetical protein [Hoeflea prorocentri]|uniref:PepSY domain-containing protein n=1 Tax=Hoeflea prorocentri TaxID=1922333 RepID=A0A9X3UHI6_9HYPH|nr:hypothetical protein [Hoeflea prorocentri]MCY6380555.1 hypothetical protein [Hoeflea prorocentri]MDA5398355.1 hypothetical protein [Hoeflea prorocentri]